MCKGISIILTEYEIYWLAESNSHEVIKEKHKIFDRKIDGLLIAEAYPRGSSIFSKNAMDWEIIFENTSVWFNKEICEERVLKHLINVVMPRWIEDKKITAFLDLSNLEYTKLPDDIGQWATEVDCSNNSLTELSLPLATKVDCSNNPINFTKKMWKKGRATK